MDAQAWDSQPYWAQRVYMEGLYTERPWQTRFEINPETFQITWSSSLDLQWETFGELKNVTIDQQQDTVGIDESHVSDKEVIDEEEDFIGWKQLPDITQLVKPTYIDLPNVSD